MYVNTYLVHRCYGGPEEGGWFYNAGWPLESTWVESLEEEYAAITTQKAKRFGGHSEVIAAAEDKESIQVKIQTVIEDNFAEAYPKERPHYE